MLLAIAIRPAHAHDGNGAEFLTFALFIGIAVAITAFPSSRGPHTRGASTERSSSALLPIFFACRGSA